MSTATAPSRLARAITRRHDENFPVAFLLLPRDLRADIGNEVASDQDAAALIEARGWIDQPCIDEGDGG